jgi:hypothetical protein
MLGRSILMCAAITLAISPARAVAQQPVAKNQAHRLRLLGVYDEQSGNPIEGVKVSDVLSGSSSLTTSTGTVSLVFLPEGGSMIRLQKIGYATQTFSVAISPADTAPLTVMMKHVTELPTVVTTDSAPHYISPALRGFLDRQKLGSGYFINEAELRKNEGKPLASLLRARPGVQILQGQSSADYLLRSPRCMNGGPPQVFIDGLPIVAGDPPPSQSKNPPTRNNTPIDIRQFDVINLAGAEWYPDNTQVPLAFMRNSDRCGVLLLWTRER